jgi:hypothetical protein
MVCLSVCLHQAFILIFQVRNPQNAVAQFNASIEGSSQVKITEFRTKDRQAMQIQRD